MRRAARSIREFGYNNQALSMESFKEEAFFNVHEVPAAYLDRDGQFQRSPDKKVLVRDDGSYISTVGKNYSIVDNEDFFERIIQSLDSAGVEYQPKAVAVEGNGRRTSMVVKLPKFQMFKDTREEQDFELRVRNSFDTTLAADSMIGFLKLICTNGMTAFESDFSFRMIHKGDVALKAEEAISLYKDFEGTYQQNRTIIDRLNNSHGNRKAIEEYIGDGEFTNNRVFTGERWAKKLKEKWDSEEQTNNLWALYNIFTYILSHEYGNSYSSKVNRMQILNREAKTWPKRFKVVGANPFS